MCKCSRFSPSASDESISPSRFHWEPHSVTIRAEVSYGNIHLSTASARTGSAAPNTLGFISNRIGLASVWGRNVP